MKAVCEVVAAVTTEAVVMALGTSPSLRAVEMVVLHTSIPSRLVALGVDPLRALTLAKGIRVTVDVAADHS